MDAQTFLLDQSHAGLLADRSTPRPLVSMKMFLLAAGIFIGVAAVLFPAGFFLACGIAEGDWNAGKIVFIAFLVIVPGLMLIACIPSGIRNYKLIRYGQVILGEVVSSKLQTNTYQNEDTAGGSGGTWTETTVSIDYAFASPLGSRISGSATQKHQALPETIPQPGEKMAVLFLDDDLHQML
jgi:hypothetical protein